MIYSPGRIRGLILDELYREVSRFTIWVSETGVTQKMLNIKEKLKLLKKYKLAIRQVLCEFVAKTVTKTCFCYEKQYKYKK